MKARLPPYAWTRRNSHICLNLYSHFLRLAHSQGNWNNTSIKLLTSHWMSSFCASSITAFSRSCTEHSHPLIFKSNLRHMCLIISRYIFSELYFYVRNEKEREKKFNSVQWAACCIRKLKLRGLKTFASMPHWLVVLETNYYFCLFLL